MKRYTLSLRNTYPECPDLSDLGPYDLEGNMLTPLSLFLPSQSQPWAETTAHPAKHRFLSSGRVRVHGPPRLSGASG